MKTSVDEYDESKQKGKKTPNHCNIKKETVVKEKRNKSKRAKHLYVPRVWFEGKNKMIIRGKADLQLSNEEIYIKMRDKDNMKRNNMEKESTDNEVRSGTQTTLANFVTVKHAKSKPGHSLLTKTSIKDCESVCDSSSDECDKSSNDCENYTYLQQAASDNDD